ncbi:MULTISPECIES: hypothetical protein [unclassified Chlorogloeopsis]|uniref:hypothetical protein n=1 Tax=unclassified Chlorogloeopsis TaxID=2620502 RepID=UPI0025AB3743|nr:hypothetical protein [Chlorogloeopsis sp. ULAP01]MDM9382612.1 hypothetical protein [Chlorogloeopsis sp. ULAP01]
MEHTIDKQALLKAIYAELENAYDDTLQEILELLKIRNQEDKEDEREFEEGLKDIAENGTIPWEEIKRNMKRNIA